MFSPKAMRAALSRYFNTRGVMSNALGSTGFLQAVAAASRVVNLAPLPIPFRGGLLPWHRQVVMRAIRKVAATQRAVICTIHQPTTYLFEMFDSLLLLKKGGQVVFFGPLGEGSSKLIPYFQVGAVVEP